MENHVFLRYPGSKYRIAPWICSFMPEHRVYLEPFAGSLAVFFQKPRSKIETLNDLNGDVVNFFRMLRDEPDRLREALALTPYAREEYNHAFELSDDPVEQARRFCVRCWMSFNGANKYKNGFRVGQTNNSPSPAENWKNLPKVLYAAAERLSGVQIECRPAFELIDAYRSPQTVIYIDPPYLVEGKNKYHIGMSKEEHVSLLEMVAHHPADILLSAYENPLYDACLLQAGWRKEYIRARKEGGRPCTETLYMNFEYGQLSLAL